MVMAKSSSKFSFDASRARRDPSAKRPPQSTSDRIRQFQQRKKFNFLASTTRGE